MGGFNPAFGLSAVLTVLRHRTRGHEGRFNPAFGLSAVLTSSAIRGLKFSGLFQSRVRA